MANTSFIGATNAGNTQNELTINKNNTLMNKVDARTAIGELTFYKLNFNKSIIDLQLVLLTAIELAEIGNLPPNIVLIILSYAEIIRGIITRIEGIFTIANKFLLQFIDCLSKYYKSECDSTIYQSFITMVKKLYPVLEITISACITLTQPIITGTNTIPPGFTKIPVLLNEYEAYVAMNIYDMIVFVLSIIDSLPDDIRKCKLAKCLFHNHGLFINGILFGVDYKVSKCTDSFDINEFIKSPNCKLNNTDTFLLFRSLFSKFESSFKCIPENEQCEILRLLYMFISYIIEVVLFEGPVVHRTLVSIPGVEPSYIETIWLSINNIELRKLISQIISKLPNPCIDKCKSDKTCSRSISSSDIKLSKY